MRLYGKIRLTNRERRPHIKKKGYALLPLGQNAKHGYAKVDIEYAWLDKYHWLPSHGYVIAVMNKKKVALSRFIMEPPAGMVVDHINGDKKDNRKSNLRVCTQTQNVWNTGQKKNNKSGYLGVVVTRYNTFQAQMRIGGRTRNLGTFKNAVEAARRYNEVAIKERGEFAKLNIIK